MRGAIVIAIICAIGIPSITAFIRSNNIATLRNTLLNVRKLSNAKTDTIKNDRDKRDSLIQVIGEKQERIANLSDDKETLTMQVANRDAQLAASRQAATEARLAQAQGEAKLKRVLANLTEAQKDSAAQVVIAGIGIPAETMQGRAEQIGQLKALLSDALAKLETISATNGQLSTENNQSKQAVTDASSKVSELEVELNGRDAKVLGAMKTLDDEVNQIKAKWLKKKLLERIAAIRYAINQALSARIRTSMTTVTNDDKN